MRSASYRFFCIFVVGALIHRGICASLTGTLEDGGVIRDVEALENQGPLARLEATMSAIPHLANDYYSPLGANPDAYPFASEPGITLWHKARKAAASLLGTNDYYEPISKLALALSTRSVENSPFHALTQAVILSGPDLKALEKSAKKLGGEELAIRLVKTSLNILNDANLEMEQRTWIHGLIYALESHFPVSVKRLVRPHSLEAEYLKANPLSRVRSICRSILPSYSRPMSLIRCLNSSRST